MRYCLLLALLPFTANAQQKAYVDTTTYPQHYFRNPLDIPIVLAGNFGECRPGHFHSGLDIKTQGLENKAVHAAADGYISRIKMEKGGFGHGIYITHPNGYITLYAHLNNFMPALQRYVKKVQYAKKHWDLDLQFSPAQFPVKKGDLIAWSGNTGGSTAPHLHFEIRDRRTEHPLNPQLFGLDIIDNRPPVPVEVVLYSGNIYEDPSLTLRLEKKGVVYKPVKTDDPNSSIIKDTVKVFAGMTGVGINVDDFMDGSDNTISFYTTKLYMDDSLQAEVTLDNIGYDETRYINAYADYKTKEIKHKWVQCLFKQPGNRLGRLFTMLNNNNGRLDLADQKVHKVEIVITDDRGNVSTIAFYVKPSDSFKPAIIKADSAVAKFKVNEVNTFSVPGVAFSLDQRQLYDDISFSFDSTPDPVAASNRYMLGHSFIPIHHYFELRIVPTKCLSPAMSNKVVMMYSEGKGQDGRAAKAESGWYAAKVRYFGIYWLDVDTTAPAISTHHKNNSDLSKAKQIKFEAEDDMTSVSSFSGYLDGKWICFEQHGSSFFYKFDEHCAKGKHRLVFKAEDENGNASMYQLNFTR